MKFSAKRVLITGGTGTVGKKLVEHFLINGAKKITIVSRNEENQVNLRRDIQEEFGAQGLSRVNFVLCDIRHNEVFRRHFADCDIVIHTAAMKHIDLCEENIQEAYEINIEGTKNVINNSIDYGVEKAILLSTDKACSPTSVYGSSKLIAERLFKEANKFNKTKFAVLRGGNICGSTGSVIPYFQKLVKKGKTTLPVTHEQMSRFWFSLNDVVCAIEYILQTMKGGEVFVPKMRAFKIVDLAKAISGQDKYEIVGLRKGERLEEPILNEHLEIFENDSFFVEWNGCDNYAKLNPQFKKSSKSYYSSGSEKRYLTVDELKELICAINQQS